MAIAGIVVGVVGVIGAVTLYSTAFVVSHSVNTLPGPPSVSTSSRPANPGTSRAPIDVPASNTIVNAVTSVPDSVADSVGLPSTSTVAPPMVKTGQPPLTFAGKPGAVWIGAEFCPYCASERWAVVMAFSKFGTFTNLKETTSSPWDSYPSTATFSFYGATYSSSYITLLMSEHESNDTAGLGTRTSLEPLTPLESNLWAKYDNPEGFPFLDVGNKYFVLTPSYDAAVLSGLNQSDIASRLTHPNDPVTQSIVGTSNYITAAICATTGQKPATVCSGTAVAEATKALGGG